MKKLKTASAGGAVFATILLIAACLAFMLEAVGKPFSGFLYEANLVICPGQEANWNGPRAGIRAGDWIVGIEEKDLHSAKEIGEKVRYLDIGTDLTYRIIREGKPLQIKVPTQLFSWEIVVFHVVPWLLFGLLSVVLGSWVLWKRPEDKVAWVHFAFSLSLGVLGATNIESVLTHHFSIQNQWSLVLVGMTGFHLSSLFPRSWSFFRSNSRQALFYIPSFLVILISIFYADPEKWETLFSCIVAFASIGMLSIVLSSFLAGMSQNSSLLNKRQAAIILIGSFISTVPTILGYFLALSGKFANFLPISNILLLAFPLSIALAILRYQLFDISVFIKRTLLYSLIGGILLVAYLGIVTVGRLWLNSDSLNLLATILSIVLYVPLQEWTKKTLDRFFSRSQYDPRQILADFTDCIHSSADLDSAAECFFKALEKALHPTRIALYRMEGEENILFRQVGDKEGRIELEVPLMVKEDRLGTLVLGPKKSDLPYHRMDSLLVKNLCQQFALWMKNAQLFLEVTHQQRLQLEALQQVDRMKDEFLSVVSHELRTPLNAVQGFGELLEREVLGPLNDEQQKAIGQILGGSDRILRLINDILDFTQIQSGAFGIFRESTDYLELVNEVVSLLTPLAEKKGIVLETDIAVESEILIDEQRIAQVLTNLVANSIKFTEEGNILIRAGLEGERLWTEVIDSGMGIQADDIEKLFAPFTQLDMSSTRREGGTGLGLSISRGIVEAHGGSIEASSPGIGKGSTFRFVIAIGADPRNP